MGTGGGVFALTGGHAFSGPGGMLGYVMLCYVMFFWGGFVGISGNFTVLPFRVISRFFANFRHFSFTLAEFWDFGPFYRFLVFRRFFAFFRLFRDFRPFQGIFLMCIGDFAKFCVFTVFRVFSHFFRLFAFLSIFGFLGCMRVVSVIYWDFAFFFPSFGNFHAVLFSSVLGCLAIFGGF